MVESYDNHSVLIAQERGDQRYAVIDLGTNSCRLLIGESTGQSFQMIESLSHIVRLGEGLESHGSLSEGAMKRTIKSLRLYAQKIQFYNVKKIRCVTTKFCRIARHSTAFISRIKIETGLSFEILTERDEAELIAIGCGELFDRKKPHVIVFDIGDGRTEIAKLSLIKGRYELQDTISLPLGVVRFSERYHGKILTNDIYQEIVMLSKKQIVSFSSQQSVDLKQLQLIGTSTTMTCLAAVQLGLQQYDRQKIDGHVFSTLAIYDVIKRLMKLNDAELAMYPCINDDHAHIIQFGCAILQAFLGIWSVKQIRIADRGLKEGVLLRLIRKDQRLYSKKRSRK